MVISQFNNYLEILRIFAFKFNNMEVTRLFDLLPHYATYFPKDDALAGKENGVWVTYSIKQYIEKVNFISYEIGRAHV